MATHSSILVWSIPWTEEPGGLQFMGSQSQTRLSDGAQQLSLRRPQSGGCCGAGVLVWRGVSWGHGRQLSVFPWEVCVDATPRGQRALPREVGGRGLCSLCRDSAFERCARAREAGGARWPCPGYVGLSPPAGTAGGWAFAPALKSGWEAARVPSAG